MYELIIATDQRGGIGYKNVLPWYINEELKIFKNKTLGKTLIFGRNTLEKLPKLNDRKIICLTKSNKPLNFNNNHVKLISNIEEVKNFEEKKENIIICGGREVYKSFLENNLIDRIHLSLIHNVFNCDVYFDFKWLGDFVIVKEEKYDEFTHYVLEKTSNGENQYLELIKNILTNGGLREGRNGKTLSLFKNDMKFDLRNGFPLLTTKKMFYRGILEEFIFFIKGETDSTILSDKNVRIWEPNTTIDFLRNKKLNYAEGVMGPMYGRQWRFYNSPYILDSNGKPLKAKGGIDQIRNVINLIKTDPCSRRILLTTYNPSQVDEGVLYPCHSIIIQFFVERNYLDLFCYNRSNDVGLGVPFNIASTSLLLILIAQLTNKTPRYCNITMGDTHIYEQHIKEIEKQTRRLPYKFPILEISDSVKFLEDLDKLSVSDFILKNYKYHPNIKMSMVA